jgi:esterase/lipase superfamily enzyme
MIKRKAPSGVINVIAHSIGTDLAINAILIRQRLFRNAGSPVPDFTRALILAAPDIGTKEFNDTLRPELVRSKMRLVVYCSIDRALAASRFANQSDARLGYCSPPVDPMPGVEIVSIGGSITDFMRHSYYLSVIEILDDIESTFEGVPNVPIPPPGMVRQIELH